MIRNAYMKYKFPRYQCHARKGFGIWRQSLKHLGHFAHLRLALDSFTNGINYIGNNVETPGADFESRQTNLQAPKEHTGVSRISALETHDIRFPTSRDFHGSDAMHPDP